MIPFSSYVSIVTEKIIYIIVKLIHFLLSLESKTLLKKTTY